MKKSITSLYFTFIFCLLINIADLKAQLYWNQAAVFAGNSSSYAAAPNSPSLDVTGSFTLEAWVNPSNTSNKGVISKGGAKGTSLIYGIRITGSRVLLVTNGAQRLISKTTTLIPVNTWTHIAATYDSTINTFKIFINGLQDTSSVIAGADPVSNSDSLFIGISGTSTPFSGKLDEVRVWNTALSNVSISVLMKSSLGLSGDGFLKNLVLSVPFQNNTGTVPYFSTMDYSDKLNNFTGRNITAFDMKDNPSKIHQNSDCAYFTSSSGAAFTAADNSVISPTNKITIECWIFPKFTNGGILLKGNNAFSDYGLKLVNGKLNAYINNTLISSADSVKRDRWSHIAFTYFGSTGVYEFYVNGKRGTTANVSPANITDGSDSLFVGIHPSTTGFVGYLDELRISNTIKTSSEINGQMFTSVNESNDNDSYNSAVYSFDGHTLPSTSGAPRLNLRGSASLTFNGAFTNGLAQSPVNNFSTGDFQDGYYINMPNKRIPEASTVGTISDTIEILSSETISDMNIFLALNHNVENSLYISLKSPLGAFVEIFANRQLSDNAANIVTVFDSDADSSLTNGSYISFGPKIKPEVNLDAVFSGVSAKGKWILSITDITASDTGFLSGWGIQINNKTSLTFSLECTSLIEGFYNPASNLLIEDTIRYFLHSIVSPYSIIDSSKGKLNSSGKALISFAKIQPLTDYFISIKHRNSIETWSSTPVKFSQFSRQASYNFSDQLTKAFGDNMIQVDSSPLRFAEFSGDINQDGTVDASDLSEVENASSESLSGYVNTDVTGDDFVDGSDVSIVENNAANSISVARP